MTERRSISNNNLTRRGIYSAVVSFFSLDFLSFSVEQIYGRLDIVFQSRFLHEFEWPSFNADFSTETDILSGKEEIHPVFPIRV